MSCSKCSKGINTRAMDTRSYNSTAGYHSTLKSEGGCDCESTTRVSKWTALPLYSKVELPGDLDVIAGSNEEGKAWRLPVTRLLAGGEFNKLQYSIDKKASKIELNPDQVTPAFIPGPNSSVEEAVADTEANKAQFLVIGNDANTKNNVIIQSSGFLVFPRTHTYQVGKTYYLHQTEKGGLTSVKPTSGIVQPLFTVVDELTININIGV